jgi:hypothetical protein
MSATLCVVQLFFIETLSRVLDPEGLAVLQVAWIHIQLGSFEPNSGADRRRSGSCSSWGHRQAGCIHEAGSVKLHILSSLLVTAFRALSVT